jgi:hypothetical protein
MLAQRELILIVANIAVLYAVIVLTIIRPILNDRKWLRREFEYYRNQYQYKCGATSLIGGKNGISYRLLSIDGGKSWLALDNDTHRVLGYVEDIYPGLIEHLQGMEALTDYVRKNGLITLGEPGGIELLEQAGFMVKAK